jgi:hypothetical protein
MFEVELSESDRQRSADPQNLHLMKNLQGRLAQVL